MASGLLYSKRMWDFYPCAVLAPAVVSGVSDRHTVLANPFAAFECDPKPPRGDSILEQVRIDGLTPGKKVLVCGVFQSPMLKEYRIPKAQRMFDEGRPPMRHDDAYFRVAERHFWECHGGGALGHPLRSRESLPYLIPVSEGVYSLLVGAVWARDKRDEVTVGGPGGMKKVRFGAISVHSTVLGTVPSWSDSEGHFLACSRAAVKKDFGALRELVLPSEGRPESAPVPISLAINE